MSCASLRWVQLYQRGFVPLIPVARAATGGEKTRDGLAYEALNLMPNLLPCLRLVAGRRPRLGPDVQRGLGVAGGLVGAGARVAVVGDAVVDAGLRADDHHRYVNPNMVCLVMYILQQPPGILPHGECDEVGWWSPSSLKTLGSKVSMPTRHFQSVPPPTNFCVRIY